MILVSVSGACSRSGKTALAGSVIASLPAGEVTAIKFTTTEDVFQACPRGTACVVCDIDVPFRLVTDSATLGQPGTDTDRLRRAGAVRVIWAIARAGAAARAWRAVEALVPADGIAVLEGSSVVPLARPDLRLFVVHPFLSPERWKPTSGPLLAAADAVIVNRSATETREPDARVMEAVRRHAREDRIQVADVTRPLAEWAPAVAARAAMLAQRQTVAR